MLFNFLKNKNNNLQEQSDDGEILARISYVAMKDSDSVIVDVELKEYNNECVQQLSYIIDALSKDTCIADTIQIIKNAMVSEDKQEYLVKLLSELHVNTKAKLLHSYNDREEPCIKPSEVFLK
jgi:hypothetical protein